MPLPLVLALTAVVLLGPAWVAAAPPALNCSTGNAAILAPQSGATLTGVVQIEGTASLGGDFQYYKLEYATAGRDDFDQHNLSGLVRQQVVNGQLGVWDSASVPDGVYAIRLRVVDATGNYCEVIATGLQVQNAVPPTPTELPTPTETEVTPPQAVVPTGAPTIQVSGPTEPASAPTATPRVELGGTSTPSSISILPGVDTSSMFDAVKEMTNGFVRAFVFGVLAMAGIMVIVGVIFFVRRYL